MDNPTPPQVVILLLNYEHPTATLDCINSLEQSDYANYRIVVVDNASQDNSRDALSSTALDIDLVCTECNVGFSGGNNVGFQHIRSNYPDCRYVWVLNNDTIVEQQTLSRLVSFAQQHPKSIVGTLIRYPNGTFQRIGNRLNRWTGRLTDYPLNHIQRTNQVESLSGCSMLIPMGCLMDIQGFDERYFLYCEDNELCLRARQHGWDCQVAPDAIVYHEEGGTTQRQSLRVSYYYQRNRLLLTQTVCNTLQWLCIQGYTRYRLVRSKMKAQSQTNQTQLNSMNLTEYDAFRLAVDDFYQGVTGPCPHPL